MTLLAEKTAYLDYYHTALKRPVETISASKNTHQNKAKLINKLITKAKDELIKTTRFSADKHKKQQSLLVLQYCTSVISLEYRHSVWPYEYMAFSRRVGELWERFCRAAWDYPSIPDVKRMDAPKFVDVGKVIRARIDSYIKDDAQNSAAPDIETLFKLIGEINMVEDEMFLSKNIPHIIDFKSGFGSNEKGNTLRLLTVGRAYKLWNPDTRLLLLVRQDTNNNYLDVIKRADLWEVHCGSLAYDAIDEFTGSDMQEIRTNIIDFEKDLSSQFWTYLSSNTPDLTAYLKW